MLLGKTWRKGHPKGGPSVALRQFPLQEWQDPVDVPWWSTGSTRRTDQLLTDPGQLFWGINHDPYEVEDHPYTFALW